MLIRDISNDPNQQIIQDYMSVLTGGRTVSVTLLYLLFAWRQFQEQMLKWPDINISIT